MAQDLLQRIPQDVDAVLTTTAGCGSTLKEYGHVTEGTAAHPKALWLQEHVKDICEFLDELGLTPPAGLPRLMRVAYHDACHLLHAQKIGQAPRRLLGKITNLQLIELPTAGSCCGSAGSYNIEQPTLAEELGRNKSREILKTEVHAVATGNIGCMVQLQRHLNESSNNPPPVWHTIEVLERAYRPRSLTEMDSVSQMSPTVF
jgi:glycolate oxidase iron-sulfur subunit